MNEREKKMEAALRDLWSWVENWSPPFLEDDEFPDTRERVENALAPTQPEAEPEEGGWEITDEDVQVVAHASPSLGFRDVLETIRDRLRARVQPRRVSEAEVISLVDRLIEEAGGVARGDAPCVEEARNAVLYAFGIEITPEEEYEHG